MATCGNWITEIVEANAAFRDRIEVAKLPVKRAPGRAVITCMDPRVNLRAIGVQPFFEDGGNDSTTRIIRTLGAIADERSLLVGILYGITNEP